LSTETKSSDLSNWRRREWC